MNDVLVVGKHTFEIVDSIPYGYHLWNIGSNMKEGYLPLVQVGGCDGCQVVGIMKAVPLKDAQKILSVIGDGSNTPKKMVARIKKFESKGIYPERVEMLKEALAILLQVKGADKL